MPALYDAVALWLVDVHLQGCALLAVAIIATMALHQPARRMAVMRATLAALAAIAVLCALPNWSVVHLTELRGHRAAHVSAEPVPAESPQIVYDAELDAYFAPVGQGSPVGVGETASLTGDLERASIWPLVVLGIQAIGSLAVAGWLAIGAMAARAVRNAACQVPAEIAEAFSATWPEAASLGRIELLASERVAAPVALGWRRPAIILPQRMMDEVGSDAFDSRDAAVQDRRKRKLAAFLAHELAHISAG
ncbi:MAG TPA: hypothetical protein PKC18_05010, partial [Lacipirellulaceae bacterium]|nr:hypothetical protein [Lacipirellulaceae bacterium]